MKSNEDKKKMFLLWPLPIIFLVCALLLNLLIPIPGQTDTPGLTGQLNLNTASLDELQRLPFIGKTKAQAIVDFRREIGPFKSLDQLLEIETIGQKTYEAIKPYLKLTGPSLFNDGRQSGPGDQQPGSIKIRTLIMTRPGEIRILPDKEYFDALILAIQNAGNRIDMAMFIFKITSFSKNRASQVLKELIAAGKRGVLVRVLLEKSGYDDDLNNENQRVAKKLRRNNIKVAFDSPDITTHTKLVVIDRRYVFIGSHNLTHSALFHNHEFSLLIDNRALARELIDYMERL